MNLAKKYGIHSIAFPLISTGKFKFPKEEAVKIAFAAAESWKKENADYDIQAVFSCVDPKVYQLACEALQKGTESGKISCHDDQIYVLIEERLNAQPATAGKPCQVYLNILIGSGLRHPVLRGRGNSVNKDDPQI